MTYGKWVDQLCRSEADFSFYRAEARGLDEMAEGYIAMFRAERSLHLLNGLFLPTEKIPYTGTHRDMLAWLYRHADFVVQLEYRAGFDHTDGYLAAQVWSGQLVFIPPTKRKEVCYA